MPETPRPRQITVADGLPSNRINALTEDRLGYLWIATSDGLARYDGTDYRIWRSEQGLRDNFVWSVHADARNRLWIGTQRAGLAMLDPARRELRFIDRSNTPALGSNEVWAVTSTRDGAVWFGTADAGLYRRDDDGRVTRFLPRAGDARSLPSASVSHLAVAPDGTLWVGTKSGPARWTGRDFERLPVSALPTPLVNGLNIEADGTLWIATERGVAARRPSGRIERSPWGEAGRVLHVLARDRNGQYWLDIPDGLGRDNEGAAVNVPLYSAVAQSLIKPSWTVAHEDRLGGLWFASIGNGLWYLPSTWRQFAVLSRIAGDPGSLGNGRVRGIANARDGGMWLVGTGGMLDLLDPETGAVEHRTRDVGAGVVPTAVLEAADGGIWVGLERGLVRVRGDEVKRWQIDDAEDAAALGAVADLDEINGAVWLATSVGAVQVRDFDGRVLEDLRAGDGRGLPAQAALHQIAPGPDGAPWLAGSHGLSTWNAGARRFEPVPGAPGTHVSGFALGGDGTVWLAMPGELVGHDWDGAALKPRVRLGAADGLPAVMPSGLVVDAAGIVWITSTRGLVRVDPQARSARLYGVRNGLPSQEFAEAPVARRGDGRLLIGNPEGVVIFDPAVVRPAAAAPTLALETIDARRDDARTEFPLDRDFVVAPGDRELRFVARLLSFDDARTHVYRFRLSDHDRDWIEVGANGERVFSRLPAGRYTLEVQGRAADNAWSPVRTIGFRVAPPWWRTWPALVGAAALLALLIWWFADAWRARLRRRQSWALAQQERELAKQASLAKTRFLATLGHEVRTPMTGVLGMSELLLATPLEPRQRGYVQAIHGAGEHLLRLVNDALDLARIESGKLELAEQAFDLRALADDVAAFVGPLARAKGLGFELDVDRNAPTGLRGDPARVRQILLNLLGNAVKFTEHGAVSLKVAPRAPLGMRLEVADTGPGLNAEQQARLFRRFEQAEGARTAARYGGSGLGLAICQELAAAMDGTITVDSEPGAGTRFIVELPLDEAEAPRAAADSDAGAPPRSAARALSLLLVEDDPTVAEVVSALLRAQGHRVAHAPHALAALAEVGASSSAASRFDAAFLDLDLPGMDGFALARQLRAQGVAMPLVALTARADADAEPLALAAGFDRFLRKPVTGAMLEAMLASVVPQPA